MNKTVPIKYLYITVAIAIAVITMVSLAAFVYCTTTADISTVTIIQNT